MPLPVYRPVKKRPKTMGPSLESLDDYCTSKIIAYALIQSQARDQEPYVGENEITERSLSLVCKRWYFFTQTQVADFGVHKINLNANRTENKQSSGLRLLRTLQPKLMKYKHIQLTGTITTCDFAKLMTILASSRVEKLDLIGIKTEGSRGDTAVGLKPMPNKGHLQKSLNQLSTLTYTISTDTKDGPTNALLWTIYQRAANLRELRVYAAEPNARANGLAMSTDRSDDARASACPIKRLASETTAGASHPLLSRLVFERLTGGSGGGHSPTATPAPAADTRNCPYGALMKRVLSAEKSIKSLKTNDNPLVQFLAHGSGRLCTRLELPLLNVSSPIGKLDLLRQLIRLPNLGNSSLTISIDNFDLIGEVKTELEAFGQARAEGARCTLNLFLADQKFSDSEERVRNLTQVCRCAEVNVYMSALQRVSIDCCHLMWSIGRALQTSTGGSDSPGSCIFKITLRTYPIKPNSVNPLEITVPLGKCPQYQISSTREDLIRHREIMRALRKDCYHQFVKSVR